MAAVRFGLFEFNPETGELLRDGRPVHLQAQPAKVLATLIGARGEVVTRETLRDALWPDGTTVDFDRGLNFAVGQVRTALGDAADSPSFIRTVPKRGYQFIAPLPPVPSPPPPDPQASPGPAPRGTSWLLIAAVGIAVAAAAVVALQFRPQPQEIRIAVAHFENETGNPELDPLTATIADSLVANLTTQTAGANSRFGIIGNAPILRRSRRFQDLDQIGADLQAKYVILGQVQKDGPEGVRVLAHLIRLPEKTHLKVSRQKLDPATASGTQLADRIVADFTEKLGLPASATR